MRRVIGNTRRPMDTVDVNEVREDAIYVYPSPMHDNNYFKLAKVSGNRRGERRQFAWVDLDTSKALTELRDQGGPFGSVQEAINAALRNGREVYEFNRIGDFCRAKADGRL